MTPFREALNRYGPVILVLIAGVLAAIMYYRGEKAGYELAIHNNGLDSLAHFEADGTLTLPPGATGNVNVIIEPDGRIVQEVQIGGAWLPLPGVVSPPRIGEPPDTTEGGRL